ncbi:MAG: hypothetical protein H7836_18015 [Magnetococcus sp. YQC-3]
MLINLMCRVLKLKKYPFNPTVIKLNDKLNIIFNNSTFFITEMDGLYCNNVDYCNNRSLCSSSICKSKQVYHIQDQELRQLIIDKLEEYLIGEL